MKYRIREQNELKPSGVEWLGNIPKDWQVSKLKYVFKSMISGGTPNSSDDKNYTDFENGIPFVSISDMSKSDFIYQTSKSLTEKGLTEKNLTILEEGTLIYSIFATIGKVAELKIKAVTNQALLGLILIDENQKQFVKYYLNFLEKYVLSFSTSNTQNNINLEKFKNFPILFSNEQQKIADFLDEKSKIFDEAISKKEQLISKLELAKQSLISEVVTGKLKIVEQNSKFQSFKREENELKSSGVEWLGDIPKDWHLSKVKYLAKIKTGGKDTENKEDDGKYPFFVRSDNIERINSYSFDGEAILTAGDGVGVGRVFHYINGKFDYHQRVYKISNFVNTNGKFFYYYFKENFYKEILKLSAKSTVDSIRLPMLENFLITVPKIEEQQKISKYLDEKLIHFDNTIEKTKQSITKLKEAKEALISQAVTGKIEVIQEEEEAKSTNEYFKRRVLAAYFIDKLQDDLSFGRVKLQKMLYMAEAVNNLDFSSSYTRHAMGPHDPQMIRSIESQLKKAKWFEAKKIKNNNFEKVEYLALEKSKEYIKYLDGRYWKQENIEYIFNLMKGMKTLQTEIVATVYSAYIDLSKENRVSQDNLLDEILNHWHDNKRNVPKEKWIRAIEWMSEKQLIKI